MKSAMVAVVIAALVGSIALSKDVTKIDFHWKFKQKSAEKLFEQKKYAEAQKELDALAATAPTPRERIECISLAAIAMAHQKQYEPAMEKAGSIEDVAMAEYTRIEVMTVSEKHAELVAAFKNATFENWPATLRHQGFLRRGDAYRMLKDNQAAVQDLERCAEEAESNPRLQVATWYRAGVIHESLKDKPRAMAAYQKGAEIAEGSKGNLTGGSDYSRVVMSMARMLAAEDKHNEALTILDKYDPTVNRIPGLQILEQSGDIRLKLGKKAEALANYEQAHKLATGYQEEKANPVVERFLPRLEKKIADLKK